MIKLSNDNKVSFNSENHVYTHIESGKQLESVTTYIKRFHEKFDAPVKAQEYAEKYGLDADEVLKGWQDKGKKSRDAGTAAHLVIENYFNTGKIETSGQYKKEAVAVKLINDFFLTGRLKPVYCEHIVYDSEKAGQIDMVAKDKNENYFILDWKTNEEIKSNNYGRMMRFPYDLIPDATLYHYSLQVHLYEEMLQEKISKTFIVHLKDNGYQFIEPFKIRLNDN